VNYFMVAQAALCIAACAQEFIQHNYKLAWVYAAWSVSNAIMATMSK